jgi:hypothetical protein
MWQLADWVGFQLAMWQLADWLGFQLAMCQLADEAGFSNSGSKLESLEKFPGVGWGGGGTQPVSRR